MDIKGKVWGETACMFRGNNIEVHSVSAVPGGYCSKHYHETKYNRFVVNSGVLIVNIWPHDKPDGSPDVTYLTYGESITIEPGVWHQFEVEPEALDNANFYEIYWMDIDPDDIVRDYSGGNLNEE